MFHRSFILFFFKKIEETVFCDTAANRDDTSK